MLDLKDVIMKSTKKLQAVYDQVKGDSKYYSFKDFQVDAKQFIKDIKKGDVVCSMKVSRSGMTRHFNWGNKYNMLINVCYNQKFNWDSVKVTGCGMDMHWHTLFGTCEDLVTNGEMEKWGLNMKCSSQRVL